MVGTSTDSSSASVINPVTGAWAITATIRSSGGISARPETAASAVYPPNEWP